MTGPEKMKEHAALIIIENNENKVLFVKRSMQKKTLPGAWAFPSGKLEEGESVYETSIREANEELGVEIEPKKILATHELPEFSSRLFFVLCSIKNGEVSIKEPEEIDRLEWIKLSDFFNRFSDNEIGHGLIWLRKNQKILEGI